MGHLDTYREAMRELQSLDFKVSLGVTDSRFVLSWTKRGALWKTEVPRGGVLSLDRLGIRALAWCKSLKAGEPCPAHVIRVITVQRKHQDEI